MGDQCGFGPRLGIERGISELLPGRPEWIQGLVGRLFHRPPVAVQKVKQTRRKEYIPHAQKSCYDPLFRPESTKGASFWWTENARSNPVCASSVDQRGHARDMQQVDTDPVDGHGYT